MTKKWEQRYQFRLTDSVEDLEVMQILENVPNNKRSEAIRSMLRFACSAMKNQQENQALMNELLNEIRKMNDLQQKRHAEILEKFNNGLIMKQANEDLQNENKMSEKALEETAINMLTSFGMEF